MRKSLQYLSFNSAIVRDVGAALKQPTTFLPTDEQEAALSAFATGDNLVIVAGAGAGKTSTLVLLAEHGGIDPDDRRSNTIHSLALRSSPRWCRTRLDRNKNRMASDQLAEALGIEPIGFMTMGKPKVLSPAFLAGVAMNGVTRFCSSADEEPEARHVKYIEGIDTPATDGRRTYENNNAVARHVLPAMDRIWNDARSERGALQYRHEYYLKMFERSTPRVDADCIMLDEGQDSSPVMASCFTQQDHAQLIVVGDPSQAINRWMGAVDALAMMPRARRTTLSMSFRFGQPIADVANVILAGLPTDLRLRGFDRVQSRVGEIDGDPDVILTRTNAAAVSALLAFMGRGVPAHLVGGGADVIAFCRGAVELQRYGSTSHHDLQAFLSWGQVQEYVRSDVQGEDLRLLVRLIDDFGADVIISALERMPTERNARVVVSTSHKSKGRAWSRVRLGPDFPKWDDEDKQPTEDDLMLLYVAATRAQNVLDPTDVPWLAQRVMSEPTDDEPADPPPAPNPIAAGPPAQIERANGHAPREAEDDQLDFWASMTDAEVEMF